MALEPAKLSDFTMAGTLGTGTTAKVVDAFHTASGLAVAIKVMDQGSSGGELRERFAREALLLSGVESRHVGKILGFGFDKGKPFLVLERLEGETLDAKLRRDGPVPPALAVRWIEQLIIGIRDCHDAKVIHRDIKPSNVFLHRGIGGEMVKLIDFGVARLRELSGDSAGLTSTHHLIGSMGYMAPEQFKNAKGVGFQADLYAVGVVVYRTLSGRLPFVSRSLEAVIRMKSEQSPPPISSIAGVVHSPVLDWFIQKALMREPQARFQSAREMLDQWWSVSASLEDRAETEISHAGALHRPGTVSPDAYLAAEEERTLRRPPVPLPSGRVVRAPTLRPPFDQGMPDGGTPDGAPPPSATTIQSYVAPPELREQAPHTVPFHTPGEPEGGFDQTIQVPALSSQDAEGADDHEEATTRNDPNLRRLVEQELELQRTRRRGGS